MYNNAHYKKPTEVTIAQMNEYLKQTEYYTTLTGTYSQWFKEKDIKGHTKAQLLKYKTTSGIRFIDDKRIYFTLDFKWGNEWITVFTDKSKNYDDNPEFDIQVDPIQSYSTFARMIKPKEFIDKSKDTYQNIDAGEIYINQFGVKVKDYKVTNLYAIQGDNNSKVGEYPYAICYDLNKAYCTAIKNYNKWPTEFLRYDDYIKDDEVGFLPNGDVITDKDIYCRWIFKYEEYPALKKYGQLMADKINKAETKRDKKALKAQLNYAIGNLANHNPFLRNMIVYYMNEYIKQFIDKNTLWYNTDSIVSTVRKPELDALLGNEVGQFKIEHEGRFIQAGTGYQWPDEKITSNKGISKQQIKNYEEATGTEFNLLTHTSVTGYNLYTYNKFNNQLERIIRYP